MKKTKTIYWTVTIIFAAFMAFTAIPDIIYEPDAVKMISGDLGYPKYFLPFIGVAKLLGSIAILVPAFKKIKEWAYAGLFFDLIAAIYSIIMTSGMQAGLLFIVVVILVGATSYIYNEKYYHSTVS